MPASSLIELRAGLCWWCGAPADSREHRLKRSDIVREYGKPPYHGLRTLTRFSGGQRQEFHGPGSRLVTFKPSLCQHCNNARSQRFDTAWDVFTSHLVQHEAQILATRTVDLPAVFGASWRARAEDLVRYVVKHLICRIIDDLPGPVRLEEELISFLSDGPRPQCLQLNACLDLGVMAMLRLISSDPCPEDPLAAAAGFLGNAPIWVQQDRRSGAWSEPQSGMYYRWLALYWKLGGPADDCDPFAEEQVTLAADDGVLGTEACELFTALADVPRSVLDDRRPDVPVHEMLRRAGYADAAARVERLARRADTAA